MAKRKISIGKVLANLFIVVVSAGGGFLLAEKVLSYNQIDLLYSIVIIIVIFVMQVIIHEGGHLVFGLLSGYKFSSFRIGSLMLLKSSKGYSIKNFKLAGTLGQCLLIPPPMIDGKIPVILYNLGGVIFNLIFGLAPILFIYLFNCSIYLEQFLTINALIGAFFAITNGVPMKVSTVNNDGHNAISLGKDKEAMRAFWIQFMVNKEQVEGTRLGEMDPEWFKMPSTERLKNPLIGSVAVYIENRLMDEERFDEADELAKYLIEEHDGVIELYKYLLIADRLYIAYINGESRDVIQSYTSKKLRSYMRSMKSFPAIIRTQYVIALSNGDEKKAAEALSRFDKIRKSYPNTADIKTEEMLMALARER